VTAGGRPRIPADPERIRALAMTGLTDAEASREAGLNISTYQRRKREAIETLTVPCPACLGTGRIPREQEAS
jgi:hypothetical protein